MGIINRWRLNGQIKESKIKAELAQLNLAESYLKEATQKFARPDADEFNWIQTGGDSFSGMGTMGYDHYEMLNQCYSLWMKDLFARSIVRNLSKFVLGKGPIILPKSENKVVLEQWKSFSKINKWQLKEKEMVRRVFRDGELFIRKFPDNNEKNLKVRFLRANNIRNPSKPTEMLKDENVSFGIGTDKDDVEIVKTYYLCDKEGNLIERIPASEIIHIKILVDSDVKRGMSFLLVAMSMLGKYGEWLDDRIVLNKVRSAIALIKTVTGTASTVDSIRDKNASERYSADRYKQKAFEKGTVITASKGVEYQMLSPNINAADVAKDGRSILLAVAAGCGFPEMFLTADWSNANYSSTMIAQNPFVREIEDWQDFFEFVYNELFGDVVRVGKDKGNIPEGESEECILKWPDLILADIQKNNAAREIQHRNKILSKTTWQQKEALDPETEKKNLEQEQGEDVYKQPFSMPTVPTNQFGSFDEE